jgi:anaerobic ribonucleoside-triphosphate reductase activating protein
MREMTIIVDTAQGALAVEDNADLNLDALADLTEQFGAAQPIACARPLEIITPQPASAEELATDVCVRVNGFYHNSLTEGPGRRSSVLFQFCPLKCKGCYVTHLHDAAGGVSISVKRLADLLLDEVHERDGVTILGGEPFAQPEGLNALVKVLRSGNCPHIVCYSGYTLEALREKAIRQRSIGAVLDEVDILIDGAYVESLSSSAGLWTGSGNQRVIDMTATRRMQKIVLY